MRLCKVRTSSGSDDWCPIERRYLSAILVARVRALCELSHLPARPPLSHDRIQQTSTITCVAPRLPVPLSPHSARQRVMAVVYFFYLGGPISLSPRPPSDSKQADVFLSWSSQPKNTCATLYKVCVCVSTNWRPACLTPPPMHPGLGRYEMLPGCHPSNVPPVIAGYWYVASVGVPAALILLLSG